MRVRGLPGGATVRIPFQESRVQLVVVIGRGVQMLPQFLFFTVGLCLGAKGAWRTMSLDSLAFSTIHRNSSFVTYMHGISVVVAVGVAIAAVILVVDLVVVVVVVPSVSPLLIVVCVTSDMDIEAVCRSSRKQICSVQKTNIIIQCAVFIVGRCCRWCCHRCCYSRC